MTDIGKEQRRVAAAAFLAVAKRSEYDRGVRVTTGLDEDGGIVVMARLAVESPAGCAVFSPAEVELVCDDALRRVVADAVADVIALALDHAPEGARA